MRQRRIAFVSFVWLAVAACSGGGTPPDAAVESTAPPGAPQSPAPAPAATQATPPSGDLAALLAGADPAKGKIQFIQCRACHSIVPEAEPGKIGPTLYRVIGRAAGTAPGFTYSEAVARSGIIWSANDIDKWLQRPGEFLPGNKMVFVGIESPQDRANIIAFIEQESAKPGPAP